MSDEESDEDDKEETDVVDYVPMEAPDIPLNEENNDLPDVDNLIVGNLGTVSRRTQC